MQTAGDSQLMLEEICIHSSLGKLIASDSFFDENLPILRKIHICDQPVHSLLHSPVVDLAPAPGQPEVLDRDLVVLLVEHLGPSSISIILRGDRRFSHNIIHIQYIETMLTSNNQVITTESD